MEGAESSGRTRFGAELKAQRNARKWTQVEFAAMIGYSGSFVSDVERGDRGASDDFAGRCDNVFELPGTFMRLWDDMQREAFPTWFAPVISLEREAAKIEGWELGAVPGLLQTGDYARSLIRASRPGDAEEIVERAVQARMERQAMLSRPKPPMLFYLIYEGVLRHVVDGPEVMGEQLDKLIKCADVPGIVIQVVPFTAYEYAGTEGLLYLYTRPGQPVAAYTECFGGARIIEEEQEVSDLATVITMLRAVALSPRDSAALMKQIRRDLAQ